LNIVIIQNKIFVLAFKAKLRSRSCESTIFFNNIKRSRAVLRGIQNGLLPKIEVKSFDWVSNGIWA